MDISNTMFNALINAISEQPSLDNLRLPTLNTWFADDNITQYIQLYYLLNDNESKETFLKLLYNSIGCLLAGDLDKYHNFSSEEWRIFEKQATTLKPLAPTYTLDLIETWILEGYAHKDICRVVPGDVVLDCGAYTGNTAFYFADLCEPNGKVYSLEPMPQSFSTLTKNIAVSEYKNIVPFQYAVDDSTGEAYFSEHTGAGSRKVDKSSLIVPKITIDDFVHNNNISNVNFIKMDVEGGENSALKGARETISRFHPKLAICIYHRPDDFITIPKTILDINPNYCFYLKHNSNNFWETVLFAVPTQTVSEIIIDGNVIDQVKMAWKAIQATHASRSKLKRQYLLQQYVEPIARKYPQLGTPRYDSRGYVYAYWPLSDDGRLHYEYLFSRNACEVSLHFEGKYEEYKELIEEICKSSIIPLRNNPGRWKGCAIICSNIDNIVNISDYMDYLIQLTYPILYQNKLLSSKLVHHPLPILFNDKERFIR